MTHSRLATALCALSLALSAQGVALAQAQTQVPAAKAQARATPEAEAAARQARQALASGDQAAAAKAFARAHALAPTNRDFVHNAAALAAAQGQREQALALFKDALALAVANESGPSTDAQAYGAQISQLLDVAPAWVDQRRDAASALPEGKARIVGLWQRARDQAGKAALAGNWPQAEQAARQALTIATDNLGASHMAAIAAAGDLARVLGQAGKAGEADQAFDTAIATATATLGAGHPETLALKAALADHLGQTNRFARAIAVAQGAQADAARDLGPHHPLSLEAAAAVVPLLLDAGEIGQAVGQAGTACADFAAAYGDSHPALARCLTLRANALLGAGDLAQAAEAANRAVAILRVTAAAGDPAGLQARIVAARAAHKRGDAAAARALLQGVLADSQAANDQAHVLAANTDLADVLADLGELAAARATITEVIAADTRLYGDSHPVTLSAMSSLGAILRQMGHLREAEQVFTTAHDRFLKVLGPDHTFTIIAANNLGEILEKAGLFDRAEPLLRQALDGTRAAQGDDAPATVVAMNNLALLHEDQGEFDKAEALYQAALSIHTRRLGAHHPETIAFANNLAYLRLMQGKDSEAASGFAAVLDDWTRLLGPNHINTLKAANNLGRALMAQGKLAEAEPVLTRALASRRAVLGAHHMDTLRSLRDLGELKRLQGKRAEALPLLHEALTGIDASLGRIHPYAFETLASLAACAEGDGDRGEALRLRRETFLRRNDFLDAMLYVTSENAREGYIRLQAGEMDAYMALLAAQGGADAGRAVLEISLLRKGLLLKVASELQQAGRLSGDPQLHALTSELEATRKRLGALTLSGPTAETGDKHAEILASLRDRIDVLQGQLGRASARFLQTTGKISIDQLVAALPEGTVLVDYLSYGGGDAPQLLAATLTKKAGKPQYGLVRFGAMAPIADSVLRYRKDIQDEDIDFDDQQDSGQHTYDRIWRPLLDKIGPAHTVYVVPDGVLNILPFAALVDDDRKYLIEDVDLHIFTSARTLLPSRLAPAKGGYMINAGPDYETEAVTGKEQLERIRGRSRAAGLADSLRGMASGLRGLRFDPLPGAEREGRLIQHTVQETGRPNTIYSKGEAQEAVLRSMNQPPEVLHIATHGFFLKADDTLRKRLLKMQRSGDIQLPPPGDNPLLRAGLAFAGINANAPLLGEIDTDNDGVLTALEVLDLNLAGTRLAILSACETGLGEIHEGEGVYGLRRAFQEAGVSSVISSLWEVSDAGTQALMSALYTRLMRGLAPHQALREAQMEMLRIGKWSSPYIWSAFFMVDG